MKKLVIVLFGVLFAFQVLAQEVPADVTAPPAPVAEDVVAPAPAPVPAEDTVVAPAEDVVPVAPAPVEDAVAAPVEDAGTAAEDIVSGPIPPAPKEEIVGTVVLPPTTDAAAVDTAKKAVSEAREGHWAVLAGMILMILVYLFNRMGMGAWIGGKAVPWVTVGLGVASSIAYGLANGEAWQTALINGIFTGTSAVAFWELGIKRLTATKADGTPRTGQGVPLVLPTVNTPSV